MSLVLQSSVRGLSAGFGFLGVTVSDLMLEACKRFYLSSAYLATIASLPQRITPIGELEIDWGSKRPEWAAYPAWTFTYVIGFDPLAGGWQPSNPTGICGGSAGGGTGTGTGTGGSSPPPSCLSRGQHGTLAQQCCSGLTAWDYDANTGVPYSGITCFSAACATLGQWAGPGGTGNRCCPPLINVSGKCSQPPISTTGGGGSTTTPIPTSGGIDLSGYGTYILIGGAALMAIMMMRKN